MAVNVSISRMRQAISGTSRNGPLCGKQNDILRVIHLTCLERKRRICSLSCLLQKGADTFRESDHQQNKQKLLAKPWRTLLVKLTSGMFASMQSVSSLLDKMTMQKSVSHV